MSTDDRTLIGDCIGGDEQALRLLTGKLLPTIANAVRKEVHRRVSPNPEDLVSELVNQTFLAIFENDYRLLRNFEGRSKLSTYMTGIARNVSMRKLSYLLSDSARMVPAIGEEPVERGMADPSAPDPQEEVCIEEARHKLRERLKERLSTEGWLYYKLIYVDDADVNTVVRIMGTNRNNVYQWKNRLKRIVMEESRHLDGNE